MRIERTERELYSFDELSEEAQSRAIENNRDWNVFDDWYDFIYEDAKAIGKLFGLDIDRIYFSGFCCQGDGACFEGAYSYRKGALKTVRDYTGNRDSELLDIVQALQDVQKRRFYRLSAQAKHSGRYYHEYCMSVNVYDDGQYYGDTDEESEEGIKEALRDFARWIYRRLEKEYDHLTGDEAIAESLIANNCEFEKDGENA